MAKELIGAFRFEIGDDVYPLSAVQSVSHKIYPYRVIERVVQECYGGVQCLYIVRGFSDNSIATQCSLTEPEVISYTEAKTMVRANRYIERKQEAAEFRRMNREVESANRIPDATPPPLTEEEHRLWQAGIDTRPDYPDLPNSH